MSVQESSVSSHLPVSQTPSGEVKNEQEAIKYGEDDWEDDPQNARNWTMLQKWTAVAIASLLFLDSYVLELTSGFWGSFSI